MEYPYFIVDNLLDGATSTVASLTEVTGYEVTKVSDNLHHTSYKTASATSPAAFTITPSAHRLINCVIIETKFSDTSGYYQVSVNGSSVVNTQTTQDIVNGTIILTFSEVVALSSSTVVVNLYSTLTTKEVRHLWVGYYRTLPNANYEFDPIQDLQVFRKQDNEDGQIINNSAKYNHKVLEATFANISPTDFGKLDYLRTNSFYTATPFWFFVRPSTDPTVGFMYHWDNDSFFRPFQTGNYRGFQIKAKANYTASRAPDRAPFAFSKCFDADGSTHYATCTAFSIGTVHTIECWIDTADADGQIVVHEASVHYFRKYTGNTFLYKTGGTDTLTLTSTTTFAEGTKHHVLLTRSGATVKLYVDGSLHDTETLATDGASAMSINRALAFNSTPDSGFNGKIGHLRIYNWVLNSTQIARQYNSGAGNDYLANGLYVVWEFDESGASSTTTNEDNQEGTANRDLTIGGTSPVRVAW